MSKLLRQQLRQFYKTHNSCDELYKYIGCSRDFFKEYIDSLLIFPMNFINIGKVWHFDHIVPLDIFNKSEYGLAWNYQNIFPMLSKDNLKKGTSVHFSIELLKTLEDTNINKLLIKKCKNEISIVYNKYLIKENRGIYLEI